MRINNWFLSAIILLVILWILISPIMDNMDNMENFELPQNNPLSSPIHLRLDANNRIVYSSFKPPSAHGELGCTQVPCPPEYKGNLTCWSCCNYH